MSLKVSDVMTPDVVTARPETAYADLVELIAARKVSGLPVVDVDGTVLGVVSEGDLMMKVAYPNSRKTREWRGMLDLYWNSFHKSDNWEALRTDLKRASALTAQEVMSTPPISIARDASLASAAALMHTRGVKRLPVVDGAGRLVGMISRADLLKQFLRGDTVLEGEVRELTAGSPRPISVSVHEGVVTLEGELPYTDHEKILPLVSGVAGVVGVVDRLRS